MTQEALIIALLLSVLLIVKPEFFNWFFYRIKTKWLRPDISVFELIIIALIILFSTGLLMRS
jgi:hypothetical protein